MAEGKDEELILEVVNTTASKVEKALASY